MIEPTERADPPPDGGGPAGETFGRWTLLRTLGRGGHGVVHVAHDTGLGRQVALKRLIAVRPAPRMLERFQREAEILARVRHPHLVTLHEAGVLGSTPYLVLELVEGGSLQARLQREGPLAPAEVARLGAQLASALVELHRHGVLHRDLKPHNVLLDAQHGPKLTDLGAALLREDAQERLTRTGELVGTIAYMAPEQVDGKHGQLDARSDVYGLGATLYAALTGQPPFGWASGVQAIGRILREPPRPPSALRRAVPPALDELVLRCLEKDPAHRFADAAALHAALEQALANGLRGALLPRALQAACLLAALLALGAWSLVALRRPPDPAAADAESAAASAASQAQVTSAAARLPDWFRALRPADRPPLRPGLRPDPDQPEAYVWARDGSQLVWVPPPARPFTMGVGVSGRAAVTTDFDRIAPGVIHASPREVLLTRGFFLGRTELTWGRYQAFCTATGREPPTRRLTWLLVEGQLLVDFELRPGGPLHVAEDDEPAFNVSWDDAGAYCAWAGLRLPSEAEWEWAARGPDPGRRYPWGDEPPRTGRLNMHDPADGYRYCAPVGRFPRDKAWCGALDMGGNLTEWVLDWVAPYPAAPATDPLASEPVDPDRPQKVTRGGGWSYQAARGFTVFYRHGKFPATHEPTVGFRVVLDAAPR